MEPLVGDAHGAGGEPTASRRDAKKRKFAHTNEAQRRAMVEWLELPGNFLLLTAPSGGLRQPSGKKVKKTDGFRALMHHVNAAAGANWTMDVIKSRFESFLTSYRKVRALAQQPDFEPTENDRTRGITERSQKLNAMCMFYDRIDALYDPKPSFQDDEVTSIDLQVQAPSTTACLAQEPQSTGSAPLEPPAVTIDVMESVDTTAVPSDISQSTCTETKTQSTQEPASTDRAADPSLSPSPSVALSELAMERERLDLLQEQLAIQKRELDLRERELQQQEEERRFAMRTELASKLIQAGKSVNEVKEILELIA